MGIVMKLLADRVAEQDGTRVWQELLRQHHLAGDYEPAESYPDQELVDLVTAHAEIRGVDVRSYIEDFGAYLGRRFEDLYPGFYRDQSAFFDFFDFLRSVDNAVHIEVRKKFPHAGLPLFSYEQPDARTLVMDYQSERKLCDLAVGLIRESARIFAVDCLITQDQCMHEGAGSCRIRVVLQD